MREAGVLKLWMFALGCGATSRAFKDTYLNRKSQRIMGHYAKTI